MKIAVIYKSKSGFVKRYAEWIAGELSADLTEYKKADPGLFGGYDAIVYGGGLYESGINGVKLITDHMRELDGKRIAVFATGASPAIPEAIQNVIDHNFKPEHLQRIRFFYLRGGFDFSKLTAGDKVLMMLLKWNIRFRKLLRVKLKPDEIGMLSAYDKPVDFVKRKNIVELVEYVRGGSQ